MSALGKAAETASSTKATPSRLVRNIWESSAVIVTAHVNVPAAPTSPASSISSRTSASGIRCSSNGRAHTASSPLVVSRATLVFTPPMSQPRITVPPKVRLKADTTGRISPVRIIGVIDLKDGEAVHARGGRRDEYAAVSEAAGTVIHGDAVKLAGVYLESFGLTDVYVADLDAIASTEPNDDVVRSICNRGGNVFVDGGVATLEQAHRVAAAGAHEVIVGLETLESFDTLRDICSRYPVTF